PEAKPARPKARKKKSARTNPKPVSQSKAGAAKPSPAPWTFPKNSLEDALNIAKAIEEQNAGNPMKADMLVRAVGFSTVNDWRFLELLRSANQYGIVEGSGRHATVRLTEMGKISWLPVRPKRGKTRLSRRSIMWNNFLVSRSFIAERNFPKMSSLKTPYTGNFQSREIELRHLLMFLLRI
ncbi:MAG TPA: hypothetical protein VGR19_02135, partial [Allosphingosinicella sp.]|nr:hypothetical protein [Allosphingosinicella sp.]